MHSVGSVSLLFYDVQCNLGFQLQLMIVSSVSFHAVQPTPLCSAGLDAMVHSCQTRPALLCICICCRWTYTVCREESEDHFSK